MGNAFERVSWAIARLGLMASGLLLVVLAVLGTADVISSNVFQAPVAAATEFASAILPATVLLALAWSQRQRDHIAVEVFLQLLPARGHAVLEFLSLTAALVFFSLLFYGAAQIAVESWRIQETAVAAVRFPIYPMKIAFAAGAGLGVFECVRQLIRFARGERRPPDVITRSGAD